MARGLVVSSGQEGQSSIKASPDGWIDGRKNEVKEKMRGEIKVSFSEHFLNCGDVILVSQFI